MIPKRDQDTLRSHFAGQLQSRVRVDLFVQRPSPIIIPGRPDCAFCEDVQTLVQELASLSPRISPTLHDFYTEPKAAADLGVDRIPAIVIRGKSNRPMRFFGIPTGAEFPALIDTLIETSRDETKLQLSTIKLLKRIRDEVKLQVFVTPSCEQSPAVTRLAFRIAQQHNRVRADVFEIAEFPDLVQRYEVAVTPTIVIDDSLVLTGAMDEATLVDCLLKVVEGKPVDPAAVKTGASTPFNVSQPQEVRLAGSGLIIPR